MVFLSSINNNNIESNEILIDDGIVFSKRHNNNNKIFRHFNNNNNFSSTSFSTKTAKTIISDIMTITKEIIKLMMVVMKMTMMMTTKTKGKSGNNYDYKDETIYYNSSLPFYPFNSSYSRIILALKSYSLE